MSVFFLFEDLGNQAKRSKINLLDEVWQAAPGMAMLPGKASPSLAQLPVFLADFAVGRIDGDS